MLNHGAAEVYPRPRGGTVFPTPPAAESRGLSPPTRGNRARSGRRRAWTRSIPAHAGEPVIWTPKAWGEKVYPRPRGGTTRSDFTSVQGGGLSPPTRGNRPLGTSTWAGTGSIPAHAGEPPSQSLRPSWRSVYPRPRGGTRREKAKMVTIEGLSPPTRGNPRPAASSRTMTRRSIPAHSGEPPAS